MSIKEGTQMETSVPKLGKSFFPIFHSARWEIVHSRISFIRALNPRKKQTREETGRRTCVCVAEEKQTLTIEENTENARNLFEITMIHIIRIYRGRCGEFHVSVSMKYMKFNALCKYI